MVPKGDSGRMKPDIYFTPGRDKVLRDYVAFIAR